MNIGRGFDTILGWHNNKTMADQHCKHELGSHDVYLQVSHGGEYRGTLWTGTQRYLKAWWEDLHLVVILMVSLQVMMLIEQMVLRYTCLYCLGNSKQKIDLPCGVDYNNYSSRGSTRYYYNRGGSPLAKML